MFPVLIHPVYTRTFNPLKRYRVFHSTFDSYSEGHPCTVTADTGNIPGCLFTVKLKGSTQ